MAFVGTLVLLVAICGVAVGFPVYIVLAAWTNRTRRQALWRSRNPRS